MAKQSFLGLVKISGNNWEKYESAKVAGKIVFADITSEGHVGKYIYANGIEYKVADSTNLDALIERVDSLESSMGLLEVWKVVVDASIAGLDASVKDHAERIAITETSTNTLETWRTHVDNVSIDKLDASVKDHEVRIDALKDADDVLADRIADVSQHAIDNDASIDRLDASVNALDTSVEDHESRIEALEGANNTLAERIADVSQDVINISTYVHTTVNASIDALQAKDTEIDSSITDISTRLSEIAITAADNSIGVNGTSIALAGDNYVSLTAANDTVTVGIK